MREAQIPVMRSLLQYIEHKGGIEHLEGYVAAPTGSGKTVIFAKLLEHLLLEHRLPTTLIVVPTKQLKAQTAEELRAKGFKGRIQLAQTNHRQDPQANVVITTQAGFVRQLKNAGRSINPQSIGLVIFDEAHHMQGDGTKQVMRDHMPHAGFIGFTATPDYDHKRKLEHLLPDLIHEITVHEAVDDGLIAPYRTILLPTHADLSRVVQVGKEYHQYLLNRAIDTPARNLLVARFIADSLPGLKTVVNVNTVEQAETQAELLRQHGVDALAVSGQTKDLGAILAAFHRGDIEKIVHARLLTEGFDEPTVDAVVNVAPTLSIVREKQRIGRGQRIDPSNPDKVLTIVECVDESYAKMPRFYGGADLTGEWHYGTGSDQPLQIDPAYTTLQDAEAMNQWWGGRLALPSAETLGLTLPETTYTAVAAKSFQTAPVKRQRTTAPLREDEEDRHPSNYKTATNKKQDALAHERLSARRQSSSTLLHIGTPVELAENNVIDLRGVSGEVEAAVEFLLQCDDLSEVVVTSPHDARTLQRALHAIHAHYNSPSSYDETEKEREERARGTKLPPRIALIFDAVNNAIAIYNGQSPIVAANGKKASSRQHSSTPRQRQLAKLVATILPPEDADKANCNGLDPDLFFPDRGASTKEAKGVCADCCIKEQCLHAAIIKGEKFGIWGGTSERERRRMRRNGMAKELIRFYGGDESVVTAQDDDEDYDESEEAFEDEMVAIAD